MKYDNNFLGFNGFIWFNGVVEDRNDPQKLGRVRVRCVGIHTQDKAVLLAIYLVTGYIAATSRYFRIRESPAFFVEGSWVFGYFRDGADCQEPGNRQFTGVPAELKTQQKVFMTWRHLSKIQGRT